MGDILVEDITIENSMDKSEKEALYDQKYASFFEWIGTLPRTDASNSQEDNAKINNRRFADVRAMLGTRYDEFVKDTLKVFSIDLFSNKMKSQEKDAEDSDKCNALFMSLRKTIIYFGGNREEGSATFRINLAKNYSQSKKIDTSNESVYDIFSMVSNKAKKNEMFKLLRIYATLNKNVYHRKSAAKEMIQEISLDRFVEITRMVVEQCNESVKLTDEDLRAFYIMVCNDGSIPYDKEIDIENSKATIKDIIADEHAGDNFSRIENKDLILSVIDKVRTLIRDRELLGVADREIFRLYFTESVLKALKLDSDNKPYNDEPAGNVDIYEVINPKEAELMGMRDGMAHLEEGIFHEDYIPYVFGKLPNDMYDTYCWRLAEGIMLQGKDIVACMGYGSKGTESKKRNKYHEILLGLNLMSGD